MARQASNSFPTLPTISEESLEAANNDRRNQEVSEQATQTMFTTQTDSTSPQGQLKNIDDAGVSSKKRKHEEGTHPPTHPPIP